MHTSTVYPYQYPPGWLPHGARQTLTNQFLGQGLKATVVSSSPSSQNTGNATPSQCRIAVKPMECPMGETRPNQLVLCDCKTVPIPPGVLPYPMPPPCPPKPPKKKKKKNFCPLASKRYCSKPGCPLGFPQIPEPSLPYCAKTATGEREHFIVTLLPEDKDRFATPSPDWLKALPYPAFPCTTDRPSQWEEPEDGNKKGKDKGGAEKGGKGKDKKGKKK